MYTHQHNETEREEGAALSSTAFSSLDRPLIYDPTLSAEAVSLGKTVARLHGVERELPTVAIHNFTPGYSDIDGSRITAIIPEPYGDNYLNGLSAMTLVNDEATYCMPLMPGLADYFQQQGIIPDASLIQELPYDAQRNSGSGFPESDVVSLIENIRTNLSGSLVLLAFPTDYARGQVERLGGIPVQQFDASVMNNKAKFRNASEEYGFTVAPGRLLSSISDIADAASWLKGEERAWLKLCRGSGGDLVIQLKGPIIEEGIADGIVRLYRSTHEAFEKNSFSNEAMRRFWPSEEVFPRDGTIILEKHAGEIQVNCSSLVLISDDGRFHVPSYFRQITENGAYMGSCPFTPSEEIESELRSQTEKIARYAYNNGVRGIVGIDFLVLKEEDGPRVVNIELNGRPPISSTAYMLGEKMREIHGHKHWININAYAPIPLTSMDDFEKIFGDLPSEGILPEEGAIIPQAFRTQYSRTDDGVSYLAGESHASNAVKILVSGRDEAVCQKLVGLLEERGVAFR